MSLAVTLHPVSIRDTHRFGRDCKIHCDANTISTSLVPIPKATAPIAPWVEVCESPQTIVIPGKVNPRSGPTTCMIPFLLSIIPKWVRPKSFISLSRYPPVFWKQDLRSAYPDHASAYYDPAQYIFPDGNIWFTCTQSCKSLRTALPHDKIQSVDIKLCRTIFHP